MILSIDANCILPGRVGGIETYVLGLIEALSDAPWLNRLEVITRSENHAFFQSFASARLGVHQLERPNHQGHPVANWAELAQTDPAAAQSMLAEFARRKIDLLHRLNIDLVHFPAGTINPIDLDIPAVLTIHDLQHRRFPHYFSQSEWQDRQKWWPISARRADAVIADSHFAAGEIHGQFAVPQSKLFVALPAVRQRFLHTPNSGEAATSDALPERFFLYPAAFWPHKNHRRLLEAMAQARELSSHLVLTGAGQDSPDLQRWIDELKLNGKVHLLGRVPETQLHALYRRAAAMIFPSEYEGFGLPLLEAMACGCPVAASNAASIPGVVADAALQFDPADPSAIAAAMLHMDQDQALRQHLACLGRRRVAHFTPARFAESLHAAYLHCLHLPARRAA